MRTTLVRSKVERSRACAPLTKTQVWDSGFFAHALFVPKTPNAMGFSGSVNGTTKNPGFLDFGFCQCKWAYGEGWGTKQEIHLKCTWSEMHLQDILSIMTTNIRWYYHEIASVMFMENRTCDFTKDFWLRFWGMVFWSQIEFDEDLISSNIFYNPHSLVPQVIKCVAIKKGFALAGIERVIEKDSTCLHRTYWYMQKK